MTDEEAVQHGRDFLDFVVKNDKQLRKNLYKNVTYDGDIFDDVFQTAIVKTYNVIVNKKKEIKDFEQYFFIACKFEYINCDNRKKKRLANDDRDLLWRIGEPAKEKTIPPNDLKRLLEDWSVDYNYNEAEEQEIRNQKINELMEYLQLRLEQQFTPREVDIFLIYYRLKSEKQGISYKKLADILSTDEREIKNTISKIKAFVKSNKEINEMKNKMLK